jgi:membrane protein
MKKSSIPIPRVLDKPVRLVRRIIDHNVWGLAAQTAFFLMLALMPLLLFLVSLLNQTEFMVNYDDLRLFLPHDISNLIIEISTTAPVRGGWTVVSLIASAWSASAGVWVLMKGIHRAYRKKGIPNPLLSRLLMLLFVFGFAAAIAVTLVLGALGGTLSAFLSHHLGTDSMYWLLSFRRLITLGFIFVFMTLLYTLTPGITGGFRRHMPGAFFAAVGWMASAWGYEIYMSWFGRSAMIYGSIGAVTGFMLWLLIVCVIVLSGAEINAFRWEEKEK